MPTGSMAVMSQPPTPQGYPPPTGGVWPPSGPPQPAASGPWAPPSAGAWAPPTGDPWPPPAGFPPAGPWPPSPPVIAQRVPDGLLDHPVLFDRVAAEAAVRAAQRNRTWRIISLGISGAISAAIWWFFREQLGDVTWTWIAVALAIPLVFLVAAVVREVVVRRDARGVGEGLALGIGRRGLFLRDVAVPWVELGAVRVTSGRLGASDRLVVETRQALRYDLPLAYLGTGPASLDSAVFALSGGRVRVDFSALDL